MAAASTLDQGTEFEPLRGPMRLFVRVVAIVAICATFSVIPINTFRGWPLGYWPLLVMFANAMVGTAYVVVGWLLAERRPRNAIGPLLLAFGVLWCLAAPSDLYLNQVPEGVDQADLPMARYAALYVMAVGYPLSILIAVALVLFPDGRPLSRWLLLAALVLSLCVLLGVAALALGSGTFGPVYRSIDSPFRVPGVPRRTMLSIADAANQVLTLLTVLALVGRWLRGTRIERAQVKWVALAGAVIFVTGFVAEQLDDGRHDWPSGISGLVSPTRPAARSWPCWRAILIGPPSSRNGSASHVPRSRTTSGRSRRPASCDCSRSPSKTASASMRSTRTRPAA